MNVIRCTVRLFCSSTICHKKVPDKLKGRSKSSQEWLTRQMNDQYVMKAKIENYRARSAFKLIEIDDKHNILKPGNVVVECGAAPGAWTQVCVNRINSTGKVPGKPRGLHVAIDLQPMYPIDGAHILAPLDFTKLSSQDKITELLAGQQVDVVLSDMAPSATGIREMDQDNILELANTVLVYAKQISKDGGRLLVKLWAGGRTKQLENEISLHYSRLKIIKPPSSRQDSAELFLLGCDFKRNP